MAREQVNAYARRIGTLMTVERRLLRNKEKLTDFKEPVMFLERTGGSIEYYDNVKEKEFIVPGTEEGTTKRIHLGANWQRNMPFAGKTFRAYDCHEDYAYPRMWGKLNYYQGKFPELAKAHATKKDIDNKRIPIILETANVNSEHMVLRESKYASAWEKFKFNARSANVKLLLKILMYAGIGIGGFIILWAMYGAKVMEAFASNPETVIQVVKNGTEAGKAILPQVVL